MTFLLPFHLPQTAQIHFWGRWVFPSTPIITLFFPLCSFIKKTSLVPRDAISDWSQPSASYAFLTSSSPGTSRAPSLINTADKLWMRFDYHDLEPRQDARPLPTVHVAPRNNLDAAKRRRVRNCVCAATCGKWQRLHGDGAFRIIHLARRIAKLRRLRAFPRAWNTSACPSRDIAGERGGFKLSEWSLSSWERMW